MLHSHSHIHMLESKDEKKKKTKRLISTAQHSIECATYRIKTDTLTPHHTQNLNFVMFIVHIAHIMHI